MMKMKKKGKRSVIDDVNQERKWIINDKSDFYIREAYKSLRTNVMFSLASGTRNQVIMITSSNQGEGKSITAVNLAVSFAQDGKKVLLVDCDLRRPKIARLLQIQSKTGLSNLLIKPELRKEAIVESSYKNLKLLPAGDIPPNPSELLGSKRMADLVEDMRAEFDYIIIDTPPLNVVTDGMILSSQADGTLFVVRSGLAERSAVLRAIDLLERANAKLLGFVLNGVSEKSRGYKGYSY